MKLQLQRCSAPLSRLTLLFTGKQRGHFKCGCAEELLSEGLDLKQLLCKQRIWCNLGSKRLERGIYSGGIVVPRLLLQSCWLRGWQRRFSPAPAHAPLKTGAAERARAEFSLLFVGLPPWLLYLSAAF